ncbi:hypothetical protein LV564_15420 [Komagataeibacter nataicola]|uniref:hypothetical protein n=1 Tax=Komagataeibacter nataicola TaxID=265960 RepID=UPI00197C6F24|nr:hypothetical protein [Komagataeibacter nataicola]WEQ55443.1 hypothetical protein LV564_15420 [Komagataeibacter nataicola]GBR19754.1 hypothetical protein AA0616_1618 [Komagataeibacter nataicola NRIC 0616]
MSAFSRLWYRAPLWRLCLYLIVPFVVLTFVFPPGYLTRRLPRMAQIATAIHNRLGMQDTPADADQAGGPGDGVVTIMPVTDRLTKAIPFAGRILPLPAGVWHPLVNIAAGPHGEVLENVLVRVQGHIVTGMIIASGTTQPVPAAANPAIDEECHDDRNYMAHIVTSHPPMMECWLTRLIDPAAIDHMSIIATQLKQEDFVLPPVLLRAKWVNSTPAPDDNINGETVTVYLNPVNLNDTKILRSPDFWTKETLAQQPAASDFVKRMNTWMAGWAPVLHDGFNSDMLASSEEQRARLSTDPAAPRPGEGNPLD